MNVGTFVPSAARESTASYRKRKCSKLCNLVKRHFSEARRDYVCEQMSRDRKAFWRGVNDFVMRSKGSVNSPISLSNEKANDFNKHFANVGFKIAADIAADNNLLPFLPSHLA